MALSRFYFAVKTEILKATTKNEGIKFRRSDSAQSFVINAEMKCSGTSSETRS